jgi:microcystin-dependent protein
MYIHYAKLQWLLVSLCCCCTAFGQIGIGTNTPDPASILDISSTTRGLLIPRLSATQLTTLAGMLTAAETGMLVTDASTGKLTIWNGQTWSDPANAGALSPLQISSTNQLSLNPGTATGDLITWDGTNWVNMQPATQHFTVSADNRQPLTTLNYCISLVGIFPSQNTSEPYVGEIDLFGFDFAPKGYALCNGQLLAINQNAALFSLIGTFYGGNGTSNFQLPNLQGRVPLHFGSGPGLSSYTIGQTGGSETNTISQ